MDCTIQVVDYFALKFDIIPPIINFKLNPLSNIILNIKAFKTMVLKP